MVAFAEDDSSILTIDSSNAWRVVISPQKIQSKYYFVTTHRICITQRKSTGKVSQHLNIILSLCTSSLCTSSLP